MEMQARRTDGLGQPCPRPVVRATSGHNQPCHLRRDTLRSRHLLLNHTLFRLLPRTL
jgi:hypothetical protein